MRKNVLTDEEVELEIERLTNSEYVQLARAVERFKYKRRQYLYCLRNLEAKGKKLAEQGISYDNIEEAFSDED